MLLYWESTKRRRTRKYATELSMYDGVHVGVFLKVKMYRKAAFFCPILALLNTLHISRSLSSSLYSVAPCVHSVITHIQSARAHAASVA